jgi:hypothetical protein
MPVVHSTLMLFAASRHRPSFDGPGVANEIVRLRAIKHSAESRLLEVGSLEPRRVLRPFALALSVSTQLFQSLILGLPMLNQFEQTICADRIGSINA